LNFSGLVKIDRGPWSRGIRINNAQLLIVVDDSFGIKCILFYSFYALVIAYNHKMPITTNGGESSSSSSEEVLTPSDATDPEANVENNFYYNSDSTSTVHNGNVELRPLKIPIVGYEVMEERAKFTVSFLAILFTADAEKHINGVHYKFKNVRSSNKTCILIG